MSVTVGEILGAARAGLASLTSETVGYLVLGAADRAVQASPASFDASDIELDERGTVTVPGIRPAARDQSESQLRAVLLELLASTTQVAPALARVGRVGERAAGRLIGELEAALIPVNRAAARRALARLHRDVARARASGRLSRITPRAAPPVPSSEDSPTGAVVEPALELPPVQVRPVLPPQGSPVSRAWESAPPELLAVSEGHRPEATPFLGFWPLTVMESPEHDTDHAPPVLQDEPTMVAPIDRSDVMEITQLLFVTAPESTQQVPRALVDPPTMDPEFVGEAELDDIVQVVDCDDAPVDRTPIVQVTSTVDEVGPIIGPAWTPIVESEVAPAAPAPATEPPPLFARVEDRRAILVSARQKGFNGWILTPVDDEVPSVDLADLLMDGAAIASIPAAAESDELAPQLVEDEPAMCEPASPESAESFGSDGEVGVLADIDVTYDDGDVIRHAPVAAAADETTSSSAAADELPAVAEDAILEWVVRDEELYEDILGIPQDRLGEPDHEGTVEAQPDDVAEMDLEEILASEGDDRGEMAPEEMLGVQQDDLGEMEWMKSDEPLAETPCEVPFAKFDPRESYAPKAMMHRWEPEPELDPDVIDAGWEIDEESSPPPESVSAVPPMEVFSTESPTPPPYRARQSDVSELLAGFAVAETRSLREMARELKLIAGVAGTPLPSVASPLAAGGGGEETSAPCTSRIWPSSRDS